MTSGCTGLCFLSVVQDWVSRLVTEVLALYSRVPNKQELLRNLSFEKKENIGGFILFIR